MAKTIWAGVGALMLASAGCGASHPPPTDNLARALAALRAAQEAGAAEVPQASLQLKLAEEQVAQARAMMEEGSDEFYYITAMNENYAQPSMPAGVEADIIKGLYRVASHNPQKSPGLVRLLGSGAILPQVIEAARMLEADWGVASLVWSATSFSELARNAR